ncbi:26833_t:CDS:1, partial [Racocetra persica]
FVKDNNYPVYSYVNYKEIEEAKELSQLWNLANPNYKEFISSYKN